MQQFIEFAGNHVALVAAFGAVILLLLWTEVSRRNRGYAELTPAQAVRKINEGDISIVDIGSAAKFGKGHLMGAVNIPLARFGKPDPEIEKLAAKPVLIVCDTGNTAHQAAAALMKLGATDVSVLKGGRVQWKADQFPLVTK